MSMMIQSSFEVGPSAGSANQSQAVSDELASGESPSFFEVLARSLLPDTEAVGKKVAKEPGSERKPDPQAADDTVDPAALLMGMNLPIVLPERKPGHAIAGGAAALKDDLNALTRGGPLLPAAAADRALVAVNRAALVAPDSDALLTGLLPTAAQANLTDARVGLEKAPAMLSAKEMPQGELLAKALAEMAPATGDTKTTLPATPAIPATPATPAMPATSATSATPAAANALTAAVQTLTQNLRRTSSESGQELPRGEPAGNAVAAKLQANPGAALGLATAADSRSTNAENEAVLQQAAASKADGQFAATFEALAADGSKAVLPNAVAGLVSASMEAASAGNPAPTTLRSHLAPEVGSQGWDKALSQQMVQMGKGGQQTAELQLNPPGLGPLKVTLNLNDHQMQLTFVSNHASVRAAVEAAMPQLRATLAESGISLGNTSVSAESQPQTQNAFSQGQGRAPDHRAYPNRSLPDSAAPMAQAVTQAHRQGGGLAVDTYA